MLFELVAMESRLRGSRKRRRLPCAFLFKSTLACPSWLASFDEQRTRHADTFSHELFHIAKPGYGHGGGDVPGARSILDDKRVVLRTTESPEFLFRLEELLRSYENAHRQGLAVQARPVPDPEA